MNGFALSLALTERLGVIREWPINPLSPSSDQHQFFPKDIHRLLRQMVMRINKMINKEKMPRSFIKFFQLILKGNVWRSVWRICMWILGLEGVKNTLLLLVKDFP